MHLSWEQIVQALQAAFAAFMAGAGSFRIADKEVTIANVPGAPNHLTFGQALAAAEMALIGTTGTVQVGDVAITIGPYTG